MDFLKVLRAFLAKAYKMPDGDIDAILEASKDDQAALLQALYEKDKTRVSELTKPKEGQTFQDGYKKAKKEVLTELEEKLKADYEIETDATGAELVAEVIAAKTKAAGKAKELTEDDVKRHPVYQTAEKAFKKSLKDKETEFETTLTEKEKGFKKAQTFGNVSKKALQLLDEMNPVYPSNPKVAANLKNAFLKSLEDGTEYDEQETGFVVMKAGKVVDDGHGHTVDFDKWVKDRATDFFEFKQNNGGQNGGNGKPGDKGEGGAGGGTKYPANIVKPKTFEDMVKITNDSNIPVADRQIVLQTWETEQTAGTGN
jgi:hypothetical protein